MEYEELIKPILERLEDKAYYCPFCNKQLRSGTRYIAIQIQNKLSPIVCHKCLSKTQKQLFYNIYRESIRKAQKKYYEKIKGELNE